MLTPAIIGRYKFFKYSCVVYFVHQVSVNVQYHDVVLIGGFHIVTESLRL